MLPSATDLLLARNGFLRLDIALEEAAPADRAPVAELGTVLANMAYYGVAPARELAARLEVLDSAGLARFWAAARPLLAAVTGDDREMEAHVVYKNFPREVLEMSQADYWIRQIFMYIGLPNSLFTEDEKDRAPLDESLDLSIVELAGENALGLLFDRLRASPTAWLPAQRDAMDEIMASGHGPERLDIGAFTFRANGVALAATLFGTEGVEIVTNSATDVLRLAAALSEADPSLRTPPRFRKFKRAERRRLVGMLETCVDLEGDFARRRETWKRFLSRLHPGDYDAPRLAAAYDALYHGLPERRAARIEAGLKARDAGVLDLLSEEPGEFMRRLHQAYALFGPVAFTHFLDVAGTLTTAQILRLARYVETVGTRASFLVRPRGAWAKAQVVENSKAPIDPGDARVLLDGLAGILRPRLAHALPEGVALDPRSFEIALPSNGQELAEYGRGTSFDIPEEVRFLRSASYWAHNDIGNTWFDNGWNFFGPDWSPVDTVCWDSERLTTPSGKTGAIFSGDPTNSKDLEGRGCQMIDLYIDTLLEAGIRYAVWNVLCFSHVPFSEAREVLATLQWGVDPQKGELYEPARAQMVFPLKGEAMTKFVAYIDLKARKLVYLDADLPGSVSSAQNNIERLARLMPAMEDHLAALPRVGDLFSHAPEGEIPVRRDDREAAIDGLAWIFEKINPDSRIHPLDLEQLLEAR